MRTFFDRDHEPFHPLYDPLEPWIIPDRIEPFPAFFCQERKQIPYRAFHVVIEFLFVNFAIFNVADTFLCIGCALTALSLLRSESKSTK